MCTDRAGENNAFIGRGTAKDFIVDTACKGCQAITFFIDDE